MLLAPGQRLGYLAISPTMPAADRQALRDAMTATQMALGWRFPNAVMQYAVPHLRSLSIDVAALARAAIALSEVLTKAGYGVLPPEGTFYLWVRWPEGDRGRQWNALADRGVFVLPGSLMHTPGLFPDLPDRLRRNGRARFAGLRPGVVKGPGRLAPAAPRRGLSKLRAAAALDRCIPR